MMRIHKLVSPILLFPVVWGNLPASADEEDRSADEAAFAQMAFGFGGTAETVKPQVDRILLKRIELIDGLCEFSAGQKQRLQLAGRGDIKRLFEEIEELGTRYRPSRSDQDRIDELNRAFEPLRRSLRSGPFDDPGSLFDKTLGSVLSDEQIVKYQVVRAVFQAGGRARRTSSERGAELHVVFPAEAVTDERLARLTSLAHVRGLDLANTPLTDSGFERLAKLKDQSGLRWLRLANTRVGDDGLTFMKALPSLEVLDLHGTPVTDAGLGDLNGLAGLKRLMLTGTRITDAGLAHLNGLEQLEELTVDRRVVSETGIRHMTRLKNLRCLELSETAVTDDGMVHLKGLTKLQGIMLDGTNLTDAGLIPLRDLADLQLLDLRRTKVTDAGLAGLTGIKDLQRLFLEGTPTTAAGVAEVKRRWPGILVFR